MKKCPICKEKIIKAYWEGKPVLLELVDFITYVSDKQGHRNDKVGTQLVPHSCKHKILLPNQKDLFT